jgi:uncharacterized protein YuzE
MDSHRVSAKVAPAVTVAGITFDNNRYDAEGDVLYINVGVPGAAVDWDGTPEGDGTSYGPDGSLIGMTILNARLRLEEDGEIAFTLPAQRVVVTDLGGILE